MPWKVIDGEPKFFIETNVRHTKKMAYRNKQRVL